MKRFLLKLLFFLIASNLVKSQSTLDLHLDSIEIEAGVSGTTDFVPAFRVMTKEVDEEGRPVLLNIFEYDETSQAQPLRQHRYEYDNGNTTRFTISVWDESAKSWLVAREELNTYQDDLLASVMRKMLTNGVLQNDRLWTYKYDGEGSEIEQLLQEWDDTLQEWQNLSRKATTYNENFDIQSQTLQRFQGEVWVNVRRRMWTYDQNEFQPASTIVQIWSITEQSWINQIRKLYVLGANGIWSGAQIEEWNKDSSLWMPNLRETSIVRPTEQERILRLEIWDGDWQNSSRNINKRDVGLDVAKFQKWSQDSLTWTDRLRFSTRYDQDGLLTEKLGMESWDELDQQWENRKFTRRTRYFYTENQTTSTNLLQTDFSCQMPNPYRGGMTFFCDLPEKDKPYELVVYNLFGQIVHHQDFTPTVGFFNKQLQAGIYLTYILHSQSVYHVQKLIVID
jgi:hypothetical protein